VPHRLLFGFLRGKEKKHYSRKMYIQEKMKKMERKKNSNRQ